MLLGEIKVTDPSQQEGSTEQKLRSIYEYMQQLNKQIRFVLQNIDEDNLSPDFAQTVETVKSAKQDVEEAIQQIEGSLTEADLEEAISGLRRVIDSKAEATITDPETGQTVELWTQVIQTAAEILTKADAVYTDPDTGQETHLWTQVRQTAEAITQKANKTYTDASGNKVDLATQVQQTAEAITQKANKTYTDANGNTVDLATQVKQTAEAITQKADKTYTDANGNKVDLATQVQQTAEEISQKASKTYKDSSGNTVDVVTQVKQNATDITSKADKTYKDASGKTVNLATQVQQNAESITQKADKTYTDENGNTVNLSSQVQQSAGEISAIVSGSQPVGAVKSTKVTIGTGGVSIATGGTFTVDSGNFVLDGSGNMIANGAQINGQLLNEGKPVLTEADIYIGTAEPKTKRAGMIWLRPVADEDGNEAVQTTHTGNYTATTRQGLKSNPKTVTLSGTAQAATATNYSYEFAVPVYFYADVTSATVTVTVGSKSFSGTISGNRYNHKVVRISGVHTAWLGNASSISVKISASTDNLNNERAEDGYQISMISRAY